MKKLTLVNIALFAALIYPSTSVSETRVRTPRSTTEEATRFTLDLCGTKVKADRLHIFWGIKKIESGKCEDNPYIILSETNNEELYIQAYYDEEIKKFFIEYRNGGGNAHYRSVDYYDSKKTSSVFSEYLRSATNWNQAIEWRRVSASELTSASSGNATPKERNSSRENSANAMTQSKNPAWERGLDIELNKIIKMPPLCQFYFNINNNTGYNITDLYAGGLLYDKNGTVISSIMHIALSGRLEKGKSRILEMADLKCSAEDYLILDHIEIRFSAVEIDGKIYTNKLEKAVSGQRMSRVPNVRLK